MVCVGCIPTYVPLNHASSVTFGVVASIAPAAKKLWGLEGKEPKSLALNHLNHHDGGVWRDPTWAAPVEHPVSASLMGRRGGFPGGDTGSILSPRGSDNGAGLGVKMVEYVLGTSPTNKDNISGLEPRLRVLHLEDKDKDKPQSPKEVEVNGQSLQNGQMSEEEKAFNRTPGSRQPSPAEDELSKNGILDPSIVVMKPQEHLPQHMAHHLPPHIAPHLGVTLAESVNQQFEHFTEQPPPNAYEQQAHQQYPPPQNHQVDNAVLQQQQQQHNFDVQVRIFNLIFGLSLS
ncbi:hypothetical protein WA026_003206 [Henosepilachna vigintioctopunctata]|uniref:Uncharacterized protein n=1 Tax=Henosepilachna vigintioctopunctata TaxID=420089 RepID=A0AAW1TME2_9CUCU